MFKIDLRAIKTFITIVEWGSFQQAADKLRYAQSTVTTQIQKLETDLGVKLFKRGKKIQLTEAGRIFSEQASFIVRELESLQNTMADLVHGESGAVRLGAMEPVASFRLPGLLTPFMDNYPNIKISIQVGNTFHLSEAIRNGSLDFAVCSIPDTGVGLYFEPLFSEPLTLLVPSTHPLANKEEVCIQDLKGQRFLITSRTCPYRKKLETTLQEMGASYSSIEISSLGALNHYVQADYGIALVPSITVISPPPGTVARTIRDFKLDLVTGILRSSDTVSLGSAGKKLMAFLKKRLQLIKQVETLQGFHIPRQTESE